MSGTKNEPLNPVDTAAGTSHDVDDDDDCIEIRPATMLSDAPSDYFRVDDDLWIAAPNSVGTLSKSSTLYGSATLQSEALAVTYIGNRRQELGSRRGTFTDIDLYQFPLAIFLVVDCNCV